MMRGVKREFLQSYLEEYSWRRNMDVSKIGSFETILQSISQDYKSGQEISDLSLEGLSIDDELIEFDDDEVSESQGTRYRCVYLSKNKSEIPVTTSISYKTASQTLVAISNRSIEQHQNVDDVIKSK
jgi:hypothetical protein